MEHILKRSRGVQCLRPAPRAHQRDRNIRPHGIDRINAIAIISGVLYRRAISEGVGVLAYMVRSAAVAATITVSSLLNSATQAQAYPVDCAILLCLAGGWPASAPCTQARAVFIRRITPWPIEPPLQIWRCPMGAAFSDPARPSPVERLYDISLEEKLWSSAPRDLPLLVPVQADEHADIDISGTAFDFVRSIRVYHVQYLQGESEKFGCRIQDQTRLGDYGTQGEFRWRASNAGVVPRATGFEIPGDCATYFYRGVIVDWRDHDGNYGFEEVRY